MIRTLFLSLIYGFGVIALQSIVPLPGDLLLLAVIYFGFYEEWTLGFSISLGLGFLLDVASLAPLGTTMFAYSAVFGLICFLRSKILFRSLASRFCWIAFLTLVSELFAWSYSNSFSETGRPFWAELLVLWKKIFFNGCVGLFWLKALQWYWGLTWEQLLQPSNPLYRKREN